MRSKYILIFITCPSVREAKRIVDRLLRARLIACANLINPVRSYFWWKGRIDQAKEVLVLAKTTKDKFKIAEKKIKALHSYEVPEIVAIDISRGEKEYLRWIGESVET